MAYKKRTMRGQVIGYAKSEPVSDPLGMLASMIVVGAVEDWRELIRRKAWQNHYQQRDCNFNELRMFFKSNWCGLLMLTFDIEPAEILAILEAELAAAMQETESE